MEYLNLYDEDKNLTDEYLLRDKNKEKNIPPNRYYMVVFVIIENLDGEMLLQLTSKNKHSEIALTGGHVKKGSNGKTTAFEEIEEELGVKINLKKIKLIQTIKLEQEFFEVYHIKDDIKISNMTLDKTEVESVKYYNYEELKTLLKEKKIRKCNRSIILDYLWNYNRAKMKAKNETK